MTWFCDTCGEEIKTAHDGWVEWITVSKPEGKISKGL
jgi:hypothetical protein